MVHKGERDIVNVRRGYQTVLGVLKTFLRIGKGQKRGIVQEEGVKRDNHQKGCQGHKGGERVAGRKPPEAQN